MFDPLDNIMVGTKYLYMLSNIKMMSHLLLPPITPVREMDNTAVFLVCKILNQYYALRKMSPTSSSFLLFHSDEKQDIGKFRCPLLKLWLYLKQLKIEENDVWLK